MVLVAAGASCDRTPATREPPPLDASPRRGLPDAVEVAPSAIPAGDAATLDPCADIRARFNAVHAARTDTCKSAGDCACFNPVGGPQLGCGGVTDATTAKKLAAIEAEFHAASCPWTHNCGPWKCEPQCVAGRCTR